MSFMRNIFIKAFAWLKRPIVNITLSLSMFAISGAVFLHFTWISDVDAANSEALDLARSVAASFQIEQVKKLNAQESDINLSEYSQLKNSLQALVKANTSIRFAYFYTLKDDKVYFMVDSEPSNSKDYSPPGQEYIEATEVDKKPFISGEPVITSPETDRWGTWVSILVPVKNIESGKVLAVFGIDYPATTWHSAAISNIVQAGIIVLISLLLLISFYWVLNKNRSLKKEKANLVLANKKIICAQAIYKDMFEKSQAPMLLIKEDNGVVFDANDAACSFYGYTKGQLKNIEVSIINMQSIEEVRKKISLINQNQMHFLSQHKLASGETRDVEVYASPITIDSERFIYTIVFDITEKNKLYEIVTTNEKRLKQAQAIAHVGNWEYDLVSHKLWFSEETLEIFGSEQIPYFNKWENLMDAIYPEERPKLDLALRLLVEKREPSNIKFRIKRFSDETERILLLVAILESDHKGNPQKIMGVIQDITESSHMAEKLVLSEERFRSIFEQSPIGIGLSDALTGKVIKTNDKFLKILGRTEEEVKGLEWKLITHPDDLEYDQNSSKLLSSGESKSYNIKKRYLRPDGSNVWVSMTVSLVNTIGHASPMHICMVEDISEQINAEEALKESERSKAYLLSNLPGMAYRCMFDLEWTMEYVSGGCLSLTGYCPDELVNNQSISFNEIITPEFRDFVRNKWLETLNIKTNCQLEYTIKTKGGELKWVWEQGQGIYDAAGNVISIEGLIIDITERKKREEEIIYLNNHDILTGLYNRNYYEQEKKRLDTDRQLPISIIVGDINGLKLINDAIGHDEGDKLLIKIANILKSFCREEDILARIGGDEFSILLPKTSGKDANAITSRILKACENYRIKSHHNSFTSISLGFATKSTNGESLETVIKEAEKFMYKHKLLEHKSIHSNIISSMKATMFEKSHETEEHAERLASLTKAIGKALNLNNNQLNELELLSALHDIGKISVDDRILAKPGKLTDDEWLEMKKHPQAGYRIAKASPDLQSIADLILCHHERYDGKGYPQGLAGEYIPLLSRILSVADAYDAMTQDRVYRKAMSKEEAISEIQSNSGTQFDPQIVQAFIKIVITSNNGL